MEIATLILVYLLAVLPLFWPVAILFIVILLLFSFFKTEAGKTVGLFIAAGLVMLIAKCAGL